MEDKSQRIAWEHSYQQKCTGSQFSLMQQQTWILRSPRNRVTWELDEVRAHLQAQLQMWFIYTQPFKSPQSHKKNPHF